MHYLKHTAQEVDDKLDMIPKKWTKILDEIADQDFDPESELAQSGKAVAEAIASVENTIEEKVAEKMPELKALSEIEINKIFTEIFGND